MFAGLCISSTRVVVYELDNIALSLACDADTGNHCELMVSPRSTTDVWATLLAAKVIGNRDCPYVVHCTASIDCNNLRDMLNAI